MSISLVKIYIRQKIGVPAVYFAKILGKWFFNKSMVLWVFQNADIKKHIRNKKKDRMKPQFARQMPFTGPIYEYTRLRALSGWRCKSYLCWLTVLSCRGIFLKICPALLLAEKANRQHVHETSHSWLLFGVIYQNCQIHPSWNAWSKSGVWCLVDELMSRGSGQQGRAFSKISTYHSKSGHS